MSEKDLKLRTSVPVIDIYDVDSWTKNQIPSTTCNSSTSQLNPEHCNTLRTI
jgi:hypothetical protein